MTRAATPGTDAGPGLRFNRGPGPLRFAEKPRRGFRESSRKGRHTGTGGRTCAIERLFAMRLQAS